MTALDELALRVDSREQQLEVLEQLLGERRLSEAEFLSGRPVLQGYMSSPFGRRVITDCPYERLRLTKAHRG